MIRNEIQNIVEKVVEKLFKQEVDVKIGNCLEDAFGDYSCNVAMILAKKLGKNPIDVANEIKGKLEKEKLFEKVEVVAPGFINFFISKEYLQNQVKNILEKKEKFGELKIGNNKKINIEFISANPTGQIHIGNGRGGFYGDVLANVLDKAGYKVTREYYINDAKNSVQINNFGATVLHKGETYLTPYIESKILEVEHDTIKMNEADAGNFLASIIQKENQLFIEEELKIKFDKWFSEEEELYKNNKIEKAYKELKDKGLVYEKEDAEWLKTTDFGDSQDWVIKRGTGEFTYFLADIAYHKNKIDRGFDKIIDIWGADHQGHIKKMTAALKIFGYENFIVFATQMMGLKHGKMSKREGNVISLKWLIDEVGLDATRFFYLIKSIDTQMEFDVDLAKEKSTKSPVFYVQYAHARICSIVEKYGNFKYNSKFKNFEHECERALIKELIKLEEIVEDTSKDYTMHRLPKYSMDLATAFHKFYNDCKVISENEDLTKARMSLVLATQIVLKNTLDLMGISAPKKM